MRILVVEDVTETVESAIIYMERSCSVTVKTDFFSASDRLSREKFDLIILDVRLVDPSYNVRERGGLELISQVKTNEKSINYLSPFVLLTGQMASLNGEELKAMQGFLGVYQKIRQSAFLKFFDEFMAGS